MKDDRGNSQLRSIDDYGDHVHGRLHIASAILELAEHYQDQHDHEYEAEATAAVVAGSVKV